MSLQNRLTRVSCGAAVVLTFAVVPATWALSQTTAAKSSTRSAMLSQTGQIDINTALESQLEALPGVGEIYAKKIIANRPYNSKDQLVTKGVVPQGVYDKIKNQIIAHRIGDVLRASRG